MQLACGLAQRDDHTLMIVNRRRIPQFASDMKQIDDVSQYLTPKVPELAPQFHNNSERMTIQK
ncbi:MAG: hypothetical protein CMB79_23345 [Filomicrobium sp.]|nr:hypothetical protein [Filomicrobium sp.]